MKIVLQEIKSNQYCNEFAAMNVFLTKKNGLCSDYGAEGLHADTSCKFAFDKIHKGNSRVKDYHADTNSYYPLGCHLRSEQSVFFNYATIGQRNINARHICLTGKDNTEELVIKTS